jgi:tetratricopeptide (TPR) repeat protein
MILNYVQLGDFSAARRLVEDWLRQGAIPNDVLGTDPLLLNISIGRLENGAGNFEAAVRAFETALAIFREDWHGRLFPHVGWGLGLAYTLAGRIPEGLQQFDRAAEIAARLGSRSLMDLRLLHHGRGLLEAGRYEEAARLATEVLTLARKSAIRPAEAGALALLGEIAMRQEPVLEKEMERYVLDALALAETLEMRPLAARCHLRLAWLYERTGGPDRDRHEASARSLLAEMGDHVKLDAAGVY